MKGLEGVRDSALRVVLQTKNSRHNDTAEHYKSFCVGVSRSKEEFEKTFAPIVPDLVKLCNSMLL